MPRGQRVLAEALYRLRVQINRLGYLVERIARRDEALYDRYVVLVERGDRVAASMVAAEIAELRRTARGLLTAKLALERLALRLETAMQIGDGGLPAGLAPLVAVMEKVVHLIKGVRDPELVVELGEICDMLREYAGSVEPGGSMEEAGRLVEEAARLAEEWMRERFPQLPTAGGMVMGQ